MDELKAKNESLVEYLNKDVSKLLLSVLYLGEGGKHKSSRKLSLGNSDPKVIKFYLNLLRKCFSISEDKLRARVQCRADQNVEELEEYWHEVTGIPLSQFHKTQVDERTVGKKTKRKDYKGVCVIIYFDTAIQLELEILAEQIMEWTEEDS